MAVSSDSCLHFKRRSITVSEAFSLCGLRCRVAHALFLTLLAECLLPLSQPRSMTCVPRCTFYTLFLNDSFLCILILRTLLWALVIFPINERVSLLTTLTASDFYILKFNAHAILQQNLSCFFIFFSGLKTWIRRQIMINLKFHNLG